RLSVIGTNGLGDIVGPFIGVNNLGAVARLALSSQSVGGRQRMPAGGFVSGCSALIDPNDPQPIAHAGRCRGQFSGGGQLRVKLLEGLSCFSSGLGCGNTFASAGVLFWLPGLWSGVLRVHRSYLVNEVSKANNLGMLAMPMIRGRII